MVAQTIIASYYMSYYKRTSGINQQSLFRRPRKGHLALSRCASMAFLHLSHETAFDSVPNYWRNKMHFHNGAVLVPTFPLSR